MHHLTISRVVLQNDGRPGKCERGCLEVTALAGVGCGFKVVTMGTNIRHAELATVERCVVAKGNRVEYLTHCFTSLSYEEVAEYLQSFFSFEGQEQVLDHICNTVRGARKQCCGCCGMPRWLTVTPRFVWPETNRETKVRCPADCVRAGATCTNLGGGVEGVGGRSDWHFYTLCQ